MNASTVANSACAENLTARLSPVIGSKMDMFAFTPITHINKTERFCEETMLQILVDESIPSDNRKALSTYYRRRTNVGRTNVEYTLGKAGADANLGRLYATNHQGLQSFRFEIRHPLLCKFYWDVDIENCHYNIALKLAEELGVVHIYIKRYCKERNQCLDLVHNERIVAKTEFLKIAFGGNIKLYDENWSDYNPTLTPEAHEFLSNLKREMDALAEMIWNRFPAYHKLKCGKENKAIEKRPNSKAILLSYIFQSLERGCILALDAFMSSKGRYMGVLIHDGGCVEKLDGELEFPEQLLVEGAAYIKETLGYDFKLAVKPMTNSYAAPKASANEYAKMKADFELNNFLVGALIYNISDDGVRREYKMSEARVKYAPLKITELNAETFQPKKVDFIDKWIADPQRLAYDGVGFYPKADLCPPKIYNLFRGFKAEEIHNRIGHIEPEERTTLIAPILDHILNLCGGDQKGADYVIAWFAHILQHPHIKSDVGLLFRDKGGFLYEGGGVGKDSLFDYFGFQILGATLYHNVDDNAELYGSFNSMFEGKLLCYVQEAEGKANHGNVDKLKSLITKRETTINKKMIAQYSTQDKTRWVFASNNHNPLPIKQGDRRFCPFDVSAKYRNNQEYFNTLYAAFNDERTTAAFYEHLMRLSVWRDPIQFQINRPITEAYIDIRQINAPAHYKWIAHCLRTETLPESASASDLYSQFKTWYASTSARDMEKVISSTMFGKYMREAMVEGGDGVEYAPADVVRTNSCIEYRFDFPRLIKGLEALHLLQPGECHPPLGFVGLNEAAVDTEAKKAELLARNAEEEKQYAEALRKANRG